MAGLRDAGAQAPCDEGPPSCQIRPDFASSIQTGSIPSIGSANFLLTVNPLFPGGLLGILGLSLTASDIRSSSEASYVFGMNKGFLAGDASFGSLKIGGALIGRELTFSGGAAANTVLLSTPTVEVTLNKQVPADLISCGRKCTTTPISVTTDAIDINFHNAPLFGHMISGDIVIGETSASLSHLIAVPT